MTGYLDIDRLMVAQFTDLVPQGLQHAFLAQHPERVVRAAGNEGFDLALPVIVAGGLLFGECG
ncbi:hypothetical protein D3C75_1157720 [compost metagenome]